MKGVSRMANSFFSIPSLTRLFQRARPKPEQATPPAPEPVLEVASAEHDTIVALRAQLKDTEAQVADAIARAAASDARHQQHEEKSAQQLAQLSQASETLAQELQQAREALATAAAVAPTAERSRADSPVFLQALVDSSRDAVCNSDSSGKVLSWNRAAEAIFGYQSSETASLTLPLLLAPESRARFQRALEEIDIEHSQTLDLNGIRKDGSIFPIEVVLASWLVEGHKHFVVILHDASERREAEAMRRDKEAAEEANRAKSQFLANMSHELRTPLNAIIGFSEILHDRTFGELTPKQERYVGNILSSGRHLLQLINDILDLSKVEAGRVQLEYAAFSSLTAVRTVDNLVKALLQKKNITLEVEPEAGLPPLIADQAKFKQVLYNLISNAIKFTPDGGKVVVRLSSSGGGNLLQVDVQDTGIGIKPEDQVRIFKEFEQVDNSYSRQQQGTGLGLALVRKFVELHGGQIWVESAGEGQGTTFRFTIPFSPANERGASADPAVQTPSLTLVGKALALVVSNDLAATEVLTRQLQEHGYDVARTSDETMNLTQERKPTLLILDIEQSDAQGWATLKVLKEDNLLKGTPLLVIVAASEYNRALQEGAAGVLTRPLEPQSLQKALTALQETPTRTQRGRSSRMAA